MHCPYCRAENEPAFRYGGPMTVCSSCGAWFLWPPPSAADVAAHYESNRDGMPAELRTWRQDTNQAAWYSHLAKRVLRAAGKRPVKSVVDVGAGAMELASAFSRDLPNASVEAWDLFADREDIHSDRITTRRIDLNRLADTPTPAGSFDVVACVAVIEHVVDPRALLRLLSSITAPGGLTYVVGPDAGSIAHRISRKAWPYYCPDEHLTLPTLTSIDRAVSELGGSSFRLRRIPVRYSLKYLLRYLRVPLPVPRFLDAALPIPAGAFELIWLRD